jgi:hypothetical protein
VSHRALELHYFRLPRRRWEVGLLRLRQLGADAVCTPLPWAWHQPSPDRHEFDGATHPGRDVEDFLQTCRELALPVCLRVGPYVGAGLLGGGVPPWLTHANPATWALGPDRQPLRDRLSGSPLPCAEQPDYLAAVTAWYRRLTEALAGFQAPDGPIFALQTGGPAHYDVALSAGGQAVRGLPHDYHPYVAEVLWPVWLRGHHDGIAALNATWGTTYATFKDVPLTDAPPDESASFFAHVVARAEATYARSLRELGWRVPVISGIETPPWEDIAPGQLMTSEDEPPEISAVTTWAPDAPVRADGSARRQFWEIKAAWLATRAGERPAPVATVITRADAGGVRVPRRFAGAAYRLLLDGRLLDVPGAESPASPRLDYMVEDGFGQTDLLIVCRDPAAPLTGWPADYLRHLLRHTAHRLERAAAMCQAAAETLAGATPAPPNVTPGLGAESSLAEAQRAAARAARAVYRLEMVRNAVLGRALPATPEGARLEWTLTIEQLERLAPLREACARAAERLRQGASELSLSEVTPAAYQAARRRADAAAADAGALLQPALAGLRADLAAGALPPALAALTALERWLVDAMSSAEPGSTLE